MFKTDTAAQPAPSPAALTRRSLFTLAGAGAALAAAPLAARSFGTGFTHAVASGEPGARSVLLWTRFVAEAETVLAWQVSETEDFAKPVAEGSVAASPERDWCAKGVAAGLMPGRWYFYRFIAPDGTTSPVGRTRTLPEGPSATYRADPDCQRLHQVLPMIAVWDDHETANDSYRDGAQNHQRETEGDWEVRKAAAKRAYREWMPVSDEPYAAYQVGDLATLFRLDTRLEGREQQFSLEKVLAGQKDPQAAQAMLEAFREGDWANPERQLLGAAQENWLAEGLAASTASGTPWQVLVQQVLIGNLRSPQSLMDQLGTALPDFVSQRLKAANMASKAGLPLNMDAWDGYPAARERVFKAALNADANLLVLAGDTHNGWAFELAQDGAKVGVELGVCSVSSPGFENYLSFVKPDVLASALVAENPQLKWADTAQRGYMVVELTKARATTEYRFTASPRQRSTRLAATKRIVSEQGSGKLDV
jgi:alkaline phosphatase D